MSRLYLKIYLAVLASIMLFGLFAMIAIKMKGHDRPAYEIEQVVRGLTGELLPESASPDQLQTTLDRWHKVFNANLTLFDRDGQIMASAGRRLSAPDEQMRSDALQGDIWHRGHMLLALPGERLLGATDASASGRRRFRGPASVLALLALAGLAVAIVAWPLSRRLTRRIESLQDSVQTFGDGDLSTRARVRGKDEVARLAVSFNESADHIEKLVAAQKSLLANASHELRSPLARIRMAVELFAQGKATDSAQTELRRNVAELDELVDEILIASRLDASGDPSAPVNADRSRWSDLDLGGLLAEEAARCDLHADTGSLPIRGDPKLLRRLIRNLIENAQRYGAGADGSATEAITIRLSDDATRIELEVCDRGPGVPVDERERIFEPFYRARGASERAGGVGLGLSLVRQIARHHGGSVVCEARDGGGSCFRVRLPTSLRT